MSTTLTKTDLDNLGELVDELLLIRSLNVSPIKAKLLIILKLNELGIPLDEQIEQAEKLFNSNLYK